jgi:putative transposase
MKTINRAVKVRAYPTQEQRRLFARTEGACRYVYNRCLIEMGESYRAKKAGEVEKAKTVIDMSREVTQWKRQEETSWLAEVPSGPIGCQLRALDDAFKRFFKGQTKYPKKHHRQMACSIQSSLDPRHKDKAAAWADSKVLFPGFGIIKLAQPERLTTQQPKTLTLSRDACGRYFIAFQVEQQVEELPANGKTVGVDLGVKTLAVYSTGEQVKAHEAAQKLKRRLRHTQRSLSRKVGSKKGETKSNRYRRQQQRVARIQCRIADARRDTQHKLTDDLTKRFGVICLEDLNVKGMTRSAKGTAEAPGKNVAQKAGLNRGIANAGFGEIRRQIEYKAHWRGGAVLFADRFAPTSRTCSECGSYQAEFSLKIREWTCPDCGAVHDRDENAAKNIVVFATGSSPEATGGEPGCYARGGRHTPDPAELAQKTCPAPSEARTDACIPWVQTDLWEVMPSESRRRAAA